MLAGAAEDSRSEGSTATESSNIPAAKGSDTMVQLPSLVEATKALNAEVRNQTYNGARKTPAQVVAALRITPPNNRNLRRPRRKHFKTPMMKHAKVKEVTGKRAQEM